MLAFPVFLSARLGVICGASGVTQSTQVGRQRAPQHQMFYTRYNRKNPLGHAYSWLGIESVYAHTSH